jgi:hypothetical protein
MAKRFIDTDIFKKRFLRGLQGPYKLLWIYIFNDCNHAGIWIVDLEVANIYIGPFRPKLDEDRIVGYFNHDKRRVIPFNRGKWFLPGFIKFQYGSLNPKNRAHNSVIQLLQNENLLEPYFELRDGQYFIDKEKTEDIQNKVLVSPLEGAKEKEKDLDKDKDKNKDKNKGGFQPPCLEVIIMEFQKKGVTGESGKREAEIFFNHYDCKGWLVGDQKMKKWNSAVAGWVARKKKKEREQKQSKTQPVPPGNPPKFKTKEEAREYYSTKE